jgi:hypothetical protein
MVFCNLSQLQLNLHIILHIQILQISNVYFIYSLQKMLKFRKNLSQVDVNKTKPARQIRLTFALLMLISNPINI